MAVVDLEDEVVVELDPYGSVELPPPVSVSLPRVVASAVSGSTVVCLVDSRPPLLVSHDAGRTWRESGRGLPPGRAVALRENPDHVLYGARNRVFVSGDGGRFWRALAVELPEIHDVAWG